VSTKRTTERTSGRAPAVDVAHEHERGEELTLSTGVRARIVPVAASLIEEVTRRIPDPEIPVWHDPERDKDIPNENDPFYLRAMVEARRKRGEAAMEAMILFGVELIDGLPESDEWLLRLRFLDKRGLLDLSQYDIDDPLDREFVYKRYVAVGSNDFVLVGQRSGLSEEGIRTAGETFRSNEVGDTDS
jgi:hypothetical protein